VDRRTFLAGTGAVLLAAPLAAEGQTAGKVWRIGWLGNFPPTATVRPIVDAFTDGLREYGYVEGDLSTALGGLHPQRDGGLIILPTPLAFAHASTVAELALKQKLRAISPNRNFAESGGLMAYGVDLDDQMRRAATYVDRILKGARPGDLPVQQPTKFQLVINLKTAKALGLTIPPSLVGRADEVIQ
jgi:hypothetical protein